MIRKKNEFIFNKEVFKTFENVLANNSLSNGYIFYGSEGVGKKQTALKFIERIFNQFSSTSNIKEKILNKNYPDFLFIEPTYIFKGRMVKISEQELTKKNHGEIIRIEQIRHIKTFLSQKSIESDKKIVLIIDAHLLNEAASNCLLKILEEPSNGIFILITPKLNLLLETIISRCQLVRFKSFSSKELEIFLEKNLDPSMFGFYKSLNIQDLINSANGSPKKVLKNIEILSELSNEITEKFVSPPTNNIEIFEISKLISEQLEIYQQIFFINYTQTLWWRKTGNRNLIKKLEDLKVHLKNFVQPRLAWEVTLLEIAHKIKKY